MSKFLFFMAMVLTSFSAVADQSRAQFSIPNGVYSPKEFFCGLSITVEGDEVLLRGIPNKFYGVTCEDSVAERSRIVSCSSKRCELDGKSDVKAIEKFGENLVLQINKKNYMMVPHNKIWAKDTRQNGQRFEFSYFTYTAGQRLIIPAIQKEVCNSSSFEICIVKSYVCDGAKTDGYTVWARCDYVTRKATELYE